MPGSDLSADATGGRRRWQRVVPKTTTLTSLLPTRKVITDDLDKAHKVTCPTGLVCLRGRGSICVRGDHHRVAY